MNRGLARLARFARVRGGVERATKRVALAGRPQSAHLSRIQWQGVLSTTQTGGGELGDWSEKLKAFEGALLSQHLDFATVAKDLAIRVGLVTGAGTLFASLDAITKAAEARKLANLETPVEPLAKLASIPLEWAAGSILRAGRTASPAISELVKAGGAAVSLKDLTAPQVTLPAATGPALGEGIDRLGIKGGSRLEGRLASHLHDERSDAHLRKSEVRRGASNTWHVTHSPQITVVVNAAEAAHPRAIAEQMVMALQAHHSELDQKLADAWKRQAVRDERTGF